MSPPAPQIPTCPRCGRTDLSLCGESLEYRSEERPDQPLREREVRTFAYQCPCGLAFTQVIAPIDPNS